MKIGASTGYNREMVGVIAKQAARQGYVPDSIVCSDDVPAGRPAPWMSMTNAMQMGVYPFELIVKVDDTLPGITAGLNAGIWTVGITQTGNEIGLNQAQIAATTPDVLAAKLDQATARMTGAEAHYIAKGVGDIPPILEQIEQCLRRGERP